MTDIQKIDDETPPKPPQDGDLIGHIGAQKRRNKDRSVTVYIRWREYDCHDYHKDHTLRFGRTGPLPKQRDVRNLLAEARHEGAKMEWARLNGEQIRHGKVDYDIQPAAANYLDWLYELDSSPRSTYNRREMRLLDLVQWLKDNAEGIWAIKRVTFNHLQAYLHYIRGYRTTKPLKNNTVRLAMSDINAFFIFCQKQNWLDENPCDKVDLPRPNVPKSKFALPISNVRKILADAGDNPLLHLLFVTGFRIGEAASLCWRDFHADDGIIVVPTSENETNKRHGRIMPIATRLLQRLKDLRGDPDAPIFPDAAKAATRVLRKHKFLGRNISPHRCRDWFINMLPTKGCPELMLNLLIGHTPNGNLRHYIDPAAALNIDRARGFINGLEGMIGGLHAPGCP